MKIQSVTSKFTEKGEGIGWGQVAGASWHSGRRKYPGGCSPMPAPCSAPPQIRERPSAPSPSSLLGTSAFYCWAGEKTLLLPAFSPALWARGQGPRAWCHQHPAPPNLFCVFSLPLSAAEQQSGTCIIYLLGNVYWDLVFNNCHSNISFLNPLRSVAVEALNIYQCGLCVHC